MSPNHLHPYRDDPDMPPDLNGAGRCLCGLPLRHRIHDLPDATAAAREQARRLGERADE